MDKPLIFGYHLSGVVGRKPDSAIGATQEATSAPDWKWGSKPVEGPGRKIPRGIQPQGVMGR
jgi:hypothetical protein